MKGTVPVPRHWSQKRKYLQGKQGTEKSPYQLPDSILGKGGDVFFFFFLNSFCFFCH